MLSVILGLITGLAGPISNVVGKITELKLKQAEAKSNVEIKQIDQQIEEAEDRKAVLVAEAGNRIAGTINASVRMALTIPVAIILWKLMVHDKVIGSFAGCAGPTPNPQCAHYRTDMLDPNQWWVIIAVVGFYFMYDIGSRILRNK